MNREIKFRAWNKESKQYVPPMTIQEMIYSTKNEFSLERLNEWFIFEQYTGLNDNNGVEIYEYSELDGTYEVVFKDLKYILRHISNNDIIDLYDYWRGKNGEVEVTRKYTKV